jgi:hypothetical protein
MTALHSFEGACHCHAIGFVYRTGRDPTRWNVRACQCSFCRAHAALTASDPLGSLEFIEHERGIMRPYRFGQRTADFLICSRCGVYLGAAMRSERGRFGIINTRALWPLSLSLPEPALMNYEGEQVGERTARREERWTPVTGAGVRALAGD